MLAEVVLAAVVLAAVVLAAVVLVVVYELTQIAALAARDAATTRR